jgi:hypothetical protein
MKYVVYAVVIGVVFYIGFTVGKKKAIKAQNAA